MADSNFTGTRDKNSPSNSVKVLTVDTRFEMTALSWTSDEVGAAKTAEIDLRGQVLFGNLWLHVEETGTTPVEPGDIDISYRPLAQQVSGTLGVTQNTGALLESGGNYDTDGPRLHSFDLNKWFEINGNATLYIGGDGGRFTFSPASTDFVGTLNATLVVR